MKKWILLIGLLTYSSVGWSEVIVSGSMQCDVTSNSVTSLEKGKVEIYSGFKDLFGVGDPLTFSYSFEQHEIGHNIEVSLRDEPDRNFRHKYSGYYSEEHLTDRAWASVDYEVPKSFRYETTGSSLNLTDSIIEWASQDSYLLLRRYYQGDWEGLLTAHFSPGADTYPNSIQITSLDCRPITDSYHRILAPISETPTIKSLKDKRDKMIQEMTNDLEAIKKRMESKKN